MKKLLFFSFSFLLLNQIAFAQCAVSPTLTLDPIPDSTGYPAGTTVTFTLTVNGYLQLGSNWFHGVILNYSSGWDMNSLTPISLAASADGQGVWGYYDSCISVGSGIVYGKGFYYDSPNTIGSGTLDSIPGNNYGDFSVAGTNTWTFVWSINVDSTAAINTSLSGSVWVTGDGVTGTWPDASCSGDIYSFNSLVGNQPCSASFSMSGYTSVLNPVNFINTSSGNLSNVLWSFGDSTFSNSLNATHTYNNIGNYNLCHFISDTSGCADSVCVPVTVVNYISNYNYNSYPYYISGTVYFDSDSNGVQSSSESTLNNWPVTLMPGNIISYTNSAGEYYFNVPIGIYTVHTNAVNNYWHISSDSLSYNIDVDTNYVNPNNYSFGLNSDTTNYSLNISGYSEINLCWWPNFFIEYSNQGTVPVNGVVSFSIDTFIHINSLNPSPDSISGGTYFWNYSNLNPFNLNEIYIDFFPINNSYIGDTFFCQSSITALDNSGLQITSANDSASQEITCAWDPNSKDVFPVGDGVNHLTPMNHLLNYTLHFQNTGNDTALTVIVRDTLSSSLDLSSFRFISSSHPCFVHLLPNREVTFEFLNIMLPDSNVDLLGSVGWINFEIAPLNNLPDSTTVSNQAGIYFDANTVVMTNIVFNTFKSQVPENANLIYSSSEGIIVYPNPTIDKLTLSISNKKSLLTEIQIVDVVGRVEKLLDSFTKDTNAVIDVSDLSDGIYFLKIKMSSGEIVVRKFVKE